MRRLTSIRFSIKFAFLCYVSHGRNLVGIISTGFRIVDYFKSRTLISLIKPGSPGKLNSHSHGDMLQRLIFLVSVV
jgi:hypothetical protein